MSKTNTKQRPNRTVAVKFDNVADDPVDFLSLYKKYADNPLELATEIARVIRNRPEEAALDIAKILTRGATLEKQLTAVHKLSRTDPLTKLFNRLHMDDELSRVCSVPKGKDHRQHTHDHNHLLMIDLDKFKPINDNYGHAAGDEALKKVAAMLTQHTRKTDVVARTGGDEFLILLKDIPNDAAEKKVAEISTAFNSLALVWAGEEIPLRASIGHWKIDAHLSTEENKTKADDRMYEVKKARGVYRDGGPA